MLLRPGSIPSGDDWAFEIKYDGFRAIVSTETGIGCSEDRLDPGEPGVRLWDRVERDLRARVLDRRDPQLRDREITVGS